MYDFAGQVAIVTGGASGIGGATARRLAADGAKVLVADINEAAAQENASRIRDAGGEADVAVTDVGSSADIIAMIDRGVELWGRLDILVNNAYSPTAANDTSALETTEEAWDTGMAILAKAIFPGQQARHTAYGAERRRKHRKHLVRAWAAPVSRLSRLRSRQERSDRHDPPNGD